MTTFQKVIKYLAIAFAIFLSVCIISGISYGVFGVAYLISGNSDYVGEMKTYSIDGEVNSITVDLSGTEFKIVNSDKFSVESNNNYISVKVDSGKLCISETKKPFVFFPKGVSVILSVPSAFVFDEAVICTGAGKVEINSLSANILKFTLGAGKTDINDLTVNTRGEINGGVGKLTIGGGSLNGVSLDMGVGGLALKSKIQGNCSLNAGIGATDLTIIGNAEDYRIRVKKGIGLAKINGKKVGDGAVCGSGANLIQIDGGIGAINVEFSAE